MGRWWRVSGAVLHKQQVVVIGGKNGVGVLEWEQYLKNISNYNCEFWEDLGNAKGSGKV